jgi:hypothetical protein
MTHLASIRTALRGADMILEAAEAEGLPMPHTTSAYAAGHQFFHFRTAEAVKEWAIWRGEAGKVWTSETTTETHTRSEAVYVLDMCDVQIRLTGSTTKTLVEFVEARVELNCQHRNVTKVTYDDGYICTDEPACHERFSEPTPTQSVSA